MNRQNFKNEKSMFPVSVETLDFMQNQTLLVAELAKVAGEYAILRMPIAGIGGVIIYESEVLPLHGSGSYVVIKETISDVVARGETYSGARVERWAELGLGPKGIPIDRFLDLSLINIKTLNDSIDQSKRDLAQHDVPKGTVIDWYGECDCDHVPYGWVPCGVFSVRSATDFAPGGGGSVEKSKWEERYEGISISTRGGIRGGVGLYISHCNGQDVPDLTDRFVVQAGSAYALGNTGGSDTVRLSAAESGLPAHSHEATTNPALGDNKTAASIEYSYNSNNGAAGTGLEIIVSACKAQDASSAHENRPPYYALYKLIKVI